MSAVSVVHDALRLRATGGGVGAGVAAAPVTSARGPGAARATGAAGVGDIGAAAVAAPGTRCAARARCPALATLPPAPPCIPPSVRSCGVESLPQPPSSTTDAIAQNMTKTERANGFCMIILSYAGTIAIGHAATINSTTGREACFPPSRDVRFVDGEGVPRRAALGF